MSTQTGKIGNKGEMYLPVSIRNEMGLQPGTRVKFIVLHNNKLYIERIPTIEDLLNQKPLMKVSVEEIEKLSEKMQSKMIEEA
ncbi:MAG: AbrB/MazE/SpoVT family DNA-binding domain-containing protein [Candidatus Heimdallarchaeota archaeon]